MLGNRMEFRDGWISWFEWVVPIGLVAVGVGRKPL